MRRWSAAALGRALLPLCLWAASGCGGQAGAPPPSAPEAPTSEGDVSPSDDFGGGAPTSDRDERPDTPNGFRGPTAAPQPTHSIAPGGSFAEPPASGASLEQWELWLESSSEALAATSDCGNACLALEGLERARAKICEIVGSGDPAGRCQRAGERVQAAKIRVETQCKCPAPAR